MQYICICFGVEKDCHLVKLHIVLRYALNWEIGGCNIILKSSFST